MYTVLADQHHMSLYNSLRLLFENRLEGQLYRPIGQDWLDRGFWKMAELYRNHPATVAQYLGINESMIDYGNGHYGIRDTQHNVMTRAITVDAFFKAPIDIVIATLPMHIESFAKLAAMHPNHPKLIYQIGNAWNVPPNSPIKNVMASAIIHEPIPSDIHFISYHQEFDTTIFAPDFEIKPGKNIFSFVNCFSTDQLFIGDWQIFQRVEQVMTDWNFRTYGGSCRDGSIGTDEEMATAIKQSRFVWHTKYGGDGYGHVIHDVASVARPLVTRVGYYMGKLGMHLMKDGVTCVGIDGLSVPEIVKKIEYYSEPARYATMCRAMYQVFREHVDFDREFLALRDFLEKLI